MNNIEFCWHSLSVFFSALFYSFFLLVRDGHFGLSTDNVEARAADTVEGARDFVNRQSLEKCPVYHTCDTWPPPSGNDYGCLQAPPQK